MKKLIITMSFTLALITPSFADFTLADLFVSGGTGKPVKTIKADDGQ